MRNFGYHQSNLYHYPPTPPEDCLSTYGQPNMAYQYHPQQFQSHVGMRHQDDRRMDYQDRFGHPMMPQMAPQAMYSNTTFMAPPSIAATAMPVNNFYKSIPGPIHPPLPPMRVFENIPHAPHIDHSRPITGVVRQQEAKEERPVGGVSAKLDYDMETMTDFVAETAHSIITPNQATPVTFRKWVGQVLSATRLPSATILLAFEYLASYMKITQPMRMVDTSETDLYHLLTTALILGSKFLDDNTFINRSWADVSNIDVNTLNTLERDWLIKFNFRLHRNPSAPDAFNSFQMRWKQYELALKPLQASPRQATHNVLPTMSQPVFSPIARPGFGYPSPPAYEAKEQQTAFHQPQSYSRFDPFIPSTSATTSPPSAPHSGPTTPEYYGPQANWAVLPSGFGFSRLPPPAYAPPQQQMPTSAVSPGVQQNVFGVTYSGPVYASGHGPECFCTACNRRYMMAPHFGLPQPVAG
jgi:hypothetical protein